MLLTLGSGFKGVYQTGSGFSSYPVTRAFTTNTTGEDIVLYLEVGNSDITYSIDGVQSGDLSGVVSAGDFGKRFIVYCNGEGGASAGDIEAAATMKFTVRATDD